jgi:hypothetical protein
MCFYMRIHAKKNFMMVFRGLLLRNGVAILFFFICKFLNSGGSVQGEGLCNVFLFIILILIFDIVFALF